MRGFSNPAVQLQSKRSSDRLRIHITRLSYRRRQAADHLPFKCDHKVQGLAKIIN